MAIEKFWGDVLYLCRNFVGFCADDKPFRGWKPGRSGRVCGGSGILRHVGFRSWLVLIVAATPALAAGAATESGTAWPAITRDCRPGVYWWWMGSAVDPANITRELERYRAAGMGGVHVIPIYGARGYEKRYIEYLSPRWMAMLRHATREADRLGMFVDMTTGTGWCFGGPNVLPREACAAIDFKTLTQRPVECPVKRSAPGGEGPMLNPFYGDAVRHYLERFTEAFAGCGDLRPRAMYHDSYEYVSDWSPDLLSEFAGRRGYSLKSEIQVFWKKSASDHAARVKSDYRETISDMMIENSIPQWIHWCRDHGFRTRYQAHGSPANLLDLYALADVPETEMFNRDRSVLISKFASSAAHVAGRKLVSAETGTWLREHFTETLADMKGLVDQLFLSGVNHIFYHGACYSPDDVPWPGWVFYASTEMNPRNSIWRDVPTLNAYVARCQSMLQLGRADNDILLYWPIYDIWHDAGTPIQQFTVHRRDWVERQPLGRVAQRLWDRGYGFDLVSDRQLAAAHVAERRIVVPGGSYQTVVVPRCDHMPTATLLKLLALARDGATVVFADLLPRDVPGAGDLENRRKEFRQALEKLQISPSADGRLQTATVGCGKIVVGDVEAAMSATDVERESMVDRAGLCFVRRTTDAGRHYFVVNRGDRPLDGWIALAGRADCVELLDPMTGRLGIGASRTSADGQTQIYLQLQPGESVILRAFASKMSGPTWSYVKSGNNSMPITGTWKVDFIEGGPELPGNCETSQLRSWTNFGGKRSQNFAGTARYTITFDAPQSPKRGLLDLGRVCQSARVRLNGRSFGTLIGPQFRVVVDGIKPNGNVLEIEATNVSANRIRDLDRRKVGWKNFHDINFVNASYRPFDASNWPLYDSGVLGPVVLTDIVELSPE